MPSKATVSVNIEGKVRDEPSLRGTSRPPPRGVTTLDTEPHTPGLDSGDSSVPVRLPGSTLPPNPGINPVEGFVRGRKDPLESTPRP